MLRFFLVLSVLLASPALSQSDEQPSSTITIEDSATQDAAMAVRIRDILGELGGYGDVTVTVNSGIVTLRGSTLEASEGVRLNEIVARVEGVVAIENEVSETTDVVERLNPAIERIMGRVWQFMAYLPLAAIAIVAFILFVGLGFFIARRKQPWTRLAPNAFIADIYRQIVRLGFVIGGLVIALDILGATALLSTILGAAGLIGLAIGFAVRDTVENFIASIMLSVRQPFRPNDVVEIGSDQGNVIRLTSRATILLSFDGNHIRIPNSTVFKSRIVNFSRNDERRFQFTIGVAPDTDLAEARAVALGVLEALPFVIETPAPSVWISDIGDSTIDIKLTAWVLQRDTSLLMARSEAIRLSIEAFDTADISMPEPTYRLLSDGAAPEEAKKRKSRKKKKAKAVAADVRAEHELEDIVNAERDEQKADDLLNRVGAEQE